MSETVLDPQMLESLRSLQGPDDPHFVREYFSAVLEAFSKHLGDLAAAVTANDRTRIAFCAHSLKSATANAGLLEVNALAAEIEHTANATQDPITVVQVTELTRRCESARVAIAALPEFKTN